MKTVKIAVLPVVLMLLLVAVSSACSGGAATPPSPDTPSPTTARALDGPTLLQQVCTRCHSLARVEREQKTFDEWDATVQRMRGKGATLTDQEAQALAEYLAETYGK